MKIILILILLTTSSIVSAGGTSYEVMLLSLNETKKDEYIFKYKKIKTDELFTIQLSYNKMRYLLKARFLTNEKYNDAIAALNEQLKAKNPVRFGWFGGGPCVVDKKNNVYRSDALDIYNEGYPEKGPMVVYSFCEYS